MVRLRLVAALAMPKSISLRLPVVDSSRLCGETSRCTRFARPPSTLSACTASSALQVRMPMEKSASSEKRSSCSRRVRLTVARVSPAHQLHRHVEQPVVGLAHLVDVRRCSGGSACRRCAPRRGTSRGSRPTPSTRAGSPSPPPGARCRPSDPARPGTPRPSRPARAGARWCSDRLWFRARETRCVRQPTPSGGDGRRARCRSGRITQRPPITGTSLVRSHSSKRTFERLPLKVPLRRARRAR